MFMLLLPTFGERRNMTWRQKHLRIGLSDLEATSAGTRFPIRALVLRANAKGAAEGGSLNIVITPGLCIMNQRV